MIDIAIKGTPANRDEIRQVLHAKAVLEGYSMATFAVKKLQIAPYVLKSLLNGVTSTAAHQPTVDSINAITGATMASWEK